MNNLRYRAVPCSDDDHRVPDKPPYSFFESDDIDEILDLAWKLSRYKRRNAIVLDYYPDEWRQQDADNDVTPPISIVCTVGIEWLEEE